MYHGVLLRIGLREPILVQKTGEQFFLPFPIEHLRVIAAAKFIRAGLFPAI